MFLILFLHSMFTWDGPVTFQPLTELEPINAESEHFLEQPMSFEMDKHGNYYLLDVGSKVIFTWDNKGVFRKVIGKPGEGPGEFVFSGRGGGQGYLSIEGEQIYVFDGRKREVMVFDLNGAFLKSLDVGKGVRGRMSGFSVVDENRFLLHRSRLRDEGLFVEIQLVDPDNQVLKTFLNEEDKTFTRRGPRGSRGGRGGATIKAFNTSPVSHYDDETGQLLIGKGDKPSFQIFDLKGGAKTIKVPLAQRDTTQSDKDEFMLRFQQGRGRVTVDFPDKKPFYNRLISLGVGGFLVYTESPYHNNLEGVHLDKNGSLKGRFDMKCGTGGGLFAARGRTLVVSLNEEDEFQVRELNIIN